VKSRNENILLLRGENLGQIKEDSSLEERFQNQTLRPILKLQNDLLILIFKNYIAENKNNFYTLNLDKKLLFIENAIQKDTKLRNLYKGVILALFTIEEYDLFSTHSTTLNKRLISMLIERLKSQLQLFEL